MKINNQMLQYIERYAQYAQDERYAQHAQDESGDNLKLFENCMRISQALLLYYEGKCKSYNALTIDISNFKPGV
jgi:hypothetical protein